MNHFARVSLAIVAAVAWGCMSASSGASETFTFTGRVLDGAGREVEGAEIFVYDSPAIRRPADFISARTGKDGIFSLSLPRGKYWAVARVRTGDKFGPLLPGDRHSGEPVEVEAEGTAPVKRDFSVVDIREAAQALQKSREDFSLLSGRIMSHNGTPVKNAYVFAVGEGSRPHIPPYLSRWSDESGTYLLFLPRGKYVVRGALEFPPEQKSSATPELVVEVVQKEATADVTIATVGEATDKEGHAADQE